MTIKKTFACISFVCLLTPIVVGQDQTLSNDTLTLSSEQFQILQSLAADSIDTELDVPNVFTPNGDQVNDYFQVTTDGTTVYELTIFTRTGTRIYHSLSTRIFWDGKSIGGKELPEGIYYYVIVKEGSSDPIEHAGFMHLYR